MANVCTELDGSLAEFKFAAVAKRKSCYKHNQLIQRGEMSKKVKVCTNCTINKLEK